MKAWGDARLAVGTPSSVADLAAGIDRKEMCRRHGVERGVAVNVKCAIGPVVHGGRLALLLGGFQERVLPSPSPFGGLLHFPYPTARYWSNVNAPDTCGEPDL